MNRILFQFVTACPGGWVDAREVNLGCLYFDFNINSISWPNAKQHCENLNYGTFPHDTHLIEIFSDEQMTFLKNTDEIKQDTWWWNGLNNYENSNEFIWSHSKLKLNFTPPWGSGEPNKNPNSNVRMYHNGNNHEWRDIQSYSTHPICQFT